MSTEQTHRYYVEATVERDRDADWADPRVTRFGEFDAATVDEAKAKFRDEFSDEPGFVRIDWGVSRIYEVA